jgi:hypothetical protein
MMDVKIRLFIIHLNHLFVNSTSGTGNSPSQESSRANFEPKAGLFVKAKSFGSNFNKNLAGIFMAREGCLGVGKPTP